MMHGRLARRLVGSVMTGATYGAAALAILLLAVILGMLLFKGAGALNWDFFVKSAVPVGEPGGGFAHAIVGTLIIVGLACAVGVPIGVYGLKHLPIHVVGLIISIVQTVTQIQDQTLNIVPKIVAILLGLILFGRFLLDSLVGYTQRLFSMISNI
jgi:phosphate transport system permease protein